jgi:transposase
MDYFAGLDVSVKETSVCIVDDTGKIVRETRVASEPEALLQVLTNTIYRFKRVGLEAGPLSQWLYSVLAEAGLPVICVETRHMRAVLKAQINKTDRNDARGLACQTRTWAARYSITSSARKRTEGWMLRPRDFAVLRFTTNSNFVGCSTGRSAGLTPLRTFATIIPNCRQIAPRLGP